MGVASSSLGVDVDHQFDRDMEREMGPRVRVEKTEDNLGYTYESTRLTYETIL